MRLNFNLALASGETPSFTFHLDFLDGLIEGYHCAVLLPSHPIEWTDSCDAEVKKMRRNAAATDRYDHAISLHQAMTEDLIPRLTRATEIDHNQEKTNELLHKVCTGLAYISGVCMKYNLNTLKTPLRKKRLSTLEELNEMCERSTPHYEIITERRKIDFLLREEARRTPQTTTKEHLRQKFTQRTTLVTAAAPAPKAETTITFGVGLSPIELALAEEENAAKTKLKVAQERKAAKEKAEQERDKIRQAQKKAAETLKKEQEKAAKAAQKALAEESMRRQEQHKSAGDSLREQAEKIAAAAAAERAVIEEQTQRIRDEKARVAAEQVAVKEQTQKERKKTLHAEPEHTILQHAAVETDIPAPQLLYTPGIPYLPKDFPTPNTYSTFMTVLLSQESRRLNPSRITAIEQVTNPAEKGCAQALRFLETHPSHAEREEWLAGVRATLYQEQKAENSNVIAYYTAMLTTYEETLKHSASEPH